MSHRIFLTVFAIFALFCLNTKMSTNAMVNSDGSSIAAYSTINGAINEMSPLNIPTDLICTEDSKIDHQIVFSRFLAQRIGTICFTPNGQCDVEAAPIGSPCCCPNGGCGYIGE